MADSSNEEYNRDAGDFCETGDSSSNVEWRSCEQVENGTPSTSPFWDTDSDQDGPKPAELYGKYTWRIENFSKINKRELRSDPFDAGGYKWYILIYPQGCDVHNHISLFLCVSNHDKLMPGWSHFAQFTIAVVNKDPKKSKYSDTLHRFWKKEHDWGWKKFMELSKVQDGFLVEGVLVIKAQVQVIREKSDRPFRCLDRLYRRELVRIYMTNIETIYRRFVEERRTRLSKLIDDKSRWSSFRAFWSSTGAPARASLSRESSSTILKLLIKHFFIEKEVTSTLVMDALFSGLRALQLHPPPKGKKGKGERESAMVRVEGDAFVLGDDVVALLERAVGEHVPSGSGKEEKVSQNRTTKDGTTIEEMSREMIDRDERRLTEIGRRMLEIFTLAHIYNTIEVAYQEAIALRRQEELIREEEAWMNEPDSKSKKDNKDKKSKKKQGKQKKNNKKGKEKEKEEKPETENENLIEDLNENFSENGEDASTGEVLADAESADFEGPDSKIPVKEFIEREVIIKEEWTGKKNYVSSSANDDWVPVGSANKNSSSYKNQTSPSRGKTQRSKNEKPVPVPVVVANTNEKVGPTHVITKLSNEQTGPSIVANSSTPPGGSGDSIGSSASSNGRAPTPQPKQKPEQNITQKDQAPIPSQKKPEVKSQPQLQPQIINSPSKPATPKAAPVSSTANPPEKPAPTITKPSIPFKTASSSSSATSPNSAVFCVVHPVLPSVPTTPRPTLPTVLPFVPVGPPPSPKPEPVKTVAPKPVMHSKPEPASRIEPVNPVKITTSPRAVSRPMSAPVLPPAPASRPATPMAAPVQVAPNLTRSVSSSAGRVGPDPLPSTPAPSFIPQSYRSAITGSNGSNNNNPLAGLVGSHPHPNPIGFATQSALLRARAGTGSGSGTGTGTDTSDSNLSFFSSSPSDWNQNDNGSVYTKPDSRAIAEEFPHLDMINGLLDDLYDGELYCPHSGTVGTPYRPFPRSGSGRVDPLRDIGLPNGSGRVDPLRDVSLPSGSGLASQLRDMSLPSGSVRHDPLRDNMAFSSGSGRLDPLRDNMGLSSGLGRLDPLRDNMGLPSGFRVDPLRDNMGLVGGPGRVDPLRDIGLVGGSGRVDPLRDIGLVGGAGQVDPLYDMGVMNQRVYGANANSGLRNNVMYNNGVSPYHVNNGHYDYSGDLGMNLNLGGDLSNGYGIGDYSNLQNRFRYPYDNGR